MGTVIRLQRPAAVQRVKLAAAEKRSEVDRQIEGALKARAKVEALLGALREEK